jgi:osmotically-inducible protein OsmY
MLLMEGTQRDLGSPAAQDVVRMAEHRLSTDPHRALRSVACEYRRGILYLRGRLSRYYHKQLAQEAVARLDGVTQVVNEIEVSQAQSARSHRSPPARD